MQQFLEKKDIQSQKLISRTVDYMVSKYKQIQKIFSYSDPYGQIILVLHNLTKINLFYTKDAINEVSYHTASRKESIYGMAELNGHSPHRGSGATCSVSLALKTDGVDTTQLTDIIFIPNYMRLKCTQNELMYYVNLGNDFIKYDVTKDKQISLHVVQGDMRTSNFTGDGTDIQTYSIPLKTNMVDMNHIMVQVNGKIARLHDTIEDFIYGELNCVVKTGISGGIDIIFGKAVTSLIPTTGQVIKVFYPIVQGVKGNEDFPVFEFIDSGFKTTGESVDMKTYFDAKPENALKFGSDSESVEETKLLAPNVNKNRIIHDKKSLDYFLRKMNIFGDIKIFNDNQPAVLETYLFPRLEHIVNDNEDYFNFDKEKILVSAVTQQRLLDLMNPKRSQNIDIVLRNPAVKDFSMVVKVDVFREGGNGLPINLEELQAIIRQTISDYMLQMRRTNKIPKSDIVKIVDNVEGVDSVFVEFVAEEADMIDKFGNIILEPTEIALPSNNFTDKNGEQVSKALQISIEYIKYIK